MDYIHTALATLINTKLQHTHIPNHHQLIKGWSICVIDLRMEPHSGSFDDHLSKSRSGSQRKRAVGIVRLMSYLSFCQLLHCLFVFLLALKTHCTWCSVSQQRRFPVKPFSIPENDDGDNNIDFKPIKQSSQTAFPR